MIDYKIVFAGPMGAGKTTAIAALSDVSPINTEVENNDRDQFDKDTTTVGFDYGVINLGSDAHVRLYGTPGQQRFKFMWSVVAKNAIGLIILLDASREEIFEDFETYSSAYPELLASGAVVVGVGRGGAAADLIMDRLSQKIALEQPRPFPVLAIDARNRDDILLMIDALLVQIESYAEAQSITVE